MVSPHVVLGGHLAPKTLLLDHTETNQFDSKVHQMVSI